jgi:hypothetical protein
MSLFEDTNPKALKELLGEINSRTMALPDFQRDFVWEPGATQELIVSIANNYPAGSILRVRDEKRVFAAREFEGAPTLDGKKHTFFASARVRFWTLSRLSGEPTSGLLLTQSGCWIASRSPVEREHRDCATCLGPARR